MQLVRAVVLVEHPLSARAQKFEIEGEFRAGRFGFELVQQRLVKIREIADRVRALGVDVINPARERIRRRFAFVKPAERFHLSGQPLARRRQNRRLAREIAGLPAQGVLKQHRHFIVEVVPGRQHRVPFFEREPVHHVPLGQAARRTRLALPARLCARNFGNGFAVSGGNVNDVEDRRGARGKGRRIVIGAIRHSPLAMRHKLPRLFERQVRVRFGIVDAQPDVQPVRLIAEPQQHIPQRERILAAAHRHEDALVAREHFIFFDGAFGLRDKPLAVMLGAQGEFVVAHVDDRAFVTFSTTHRPVSDFRLQIADCRLQI